MERLLLALLYIFTLLAAVAAEISNLRLCADEQCEGELLMVTGVVI